jgi:hypothetical protein
MSFLQFKEKLLLIPRGPASDATSPAWENAMFPALDAIALYCMLSLGRPALYVEIGAGHSTRFARRAINDNALPTSIICIDPAPGLNVESVADEIISSKLEDTDPALFGRLNAGDILFVDGSHRVFMNSDTTVLFLEILPALKPGTIVHFHDIHLPYDYPPEWNSLYYNEQYLLAVYLMSGRLEILLPNAFVTRDTQLHDILKSIWASPQMAGLPTYGGSFWGRVRH